MADEGKTGAAGQTADSIRSAEQAGTTAAGAAPDMTGLQVTLDALTQKITRLEGGMSFAQKANEHLNRLRSEVIDLRKQVTAGKTDGYDFNEAKPRETATESVGMDRIIGKLNEIDYRLSNPDINNKWGDVLKLAKDDPEFSATYGHIADTPAVLDAARKTLRLRELEAEVTSLKNVKEKMDESKRLQAEGAFVSGQTASGQQETITMAQLEAMSPKDRKEYLEKHFTMEQLMSGAL
jgi:hypothetical protein